VEVGQEVIDCLGEDTCPVDGVDGAEAMFVVEFLVSKESLDDVL
jgi:hypothetical protein